MTGDSQRYFKAFFAELEARQIPYAILHSYQKYPEIIPGDIDYVVRDTDLSSIPIIQCELAAKLGWKLVLHVEHHISAFCSILASNVDPTCVIRLDVCSWYSEGRCSIANSETLLLDRRRYKEFYVPSASAEFIYILAMHLAKDKSVANCLPRLRELWQEDRSGAQQRFEELFGNTGSSLDAWFDRPAKDWSELRRNMCRRNGFGIVISCREIVRILKRMAHPNGIHIALLGSDGAGKSTLLAQVRSMMGSCFPNQRIFHFRPMLFEKGEPRTPCNDPHSRPPRNAVVAFGKIIYYFLDTWFGWILRILPVKWRNTLVIFDRNFDDLLVDPKRYRIANWAGLVSLLRKFLPHEDLVFVLDAPPEIVYKRKQELAIQELECQRAMLRKLARSSERYTLVTAEQSPEKVAVETCRKIVEMLAARTRRRLGISLKF